MRTRETVVRLEARRRSRGEVAADGSPAAPRLFFFLAGLSIAAFGFGLAAIVLSGLPSESVLSDRSLVAQRVVALPVVLCLAFVGLFGASWAIQSLRGRSRHQGVFYQLLGRLLRVGPRPWALLVPGTSLLAVLVAALAGDRAGLRLGVQVLACWLVLLASIGLHELGHAVAARLAGLPLASVLVGPFELRAEGPAWKVDLSRSWLSVFGGLVAVRPSALPPTAPQVLAFALGGPIATLLLLAACLLGPVPVRDLLQMPPGGSTQHLALFVAAHLAMGMLALNLVPSRSLAWGLPTDGYQIISSLRAIRRGAARR